MREACGKPRKARAGGVFGPPAPGFDLKLNPIGFSGFLAVLLALLGLVEGRAEDIAQAGARVGRAVFGHRLLVLLDLAGLDRQGQLAGLGIDLEDLGVDLLSDREAVRTLLRALARQVRLLDEAG